MKRRTASPPIAEDGKRATALKALAAPASSFPIHNIGNADDGEPETRVSHNIVDRIVWARERGHTLEPSGIIAFLYLRVASYLESLCGRE